jgi:hypothetical protein
VIACWRYIAAPASPGSPAITSVLLNTATLERIRAGEITLAFRRWKRPTLRAGGSLLTPAGRLAIGAVERIDISDVTSADARKAGFASVAELASALDYRDDPLYRVEVGPLTADPRVALRETPPVYAELSAIVARLASMDTRAARPWTVETMRLIADRPGVRAGDLARALGEERLRFKANVRKLKALGLTRSLEVGYELSARGRAVLRAMDGE